MPLSCWHTERKNYIWKDIYFFLCVNGGEIIKYYLISTPVSFYKHIYYLKIRLLNLFIASRMLIMYIYIYIYIYIKSYIMKLHFLFSRQTINRQTINMTSNIVHSKIHSFYKNIKIHGNIIFHSYVYILLISVLLL